MLVTASHFHPSLIFARLQPSQVGSTHRDKTRLQMPAKMFPHWKLLCWLFMGPTLNFDTKQRNSFLIKFGGLYNKSKILTLLFTVKYEKITLFDEFLVLLGPIISRFFACSKEEKKQWALALVLSLYLHSTLTLLEHNRLG